MQYKLNINISGIIINYASIINNLDSLQIPKKIEIYKLVPLILDLGMTSSFSLYPTMLSDNIEEDYITMYNNMRKCISKNKFNLYIVGKDLVEANIPIKDKFELYNTFVFQHEQKSQKILKFPKNLKSINNQQMVNYIIHNIKLLFFNTNRNLQIIQIIQIIQKP